MAALFAGLFVGTVACGFLADRFGLVQLIAHGYRLLSWAFLAVFVLPLLTIGVWRLRRRAPAAAPVHP